MNDTLLNNLRKEIDDIDDQLFNILAKRTNIVRKIGDHKKSAGIEPLDIKRLHKILEKRLLQAKELKLSEDFIKKLYELLHEYSLEVEKGNKK